MERVYLTPNATNKWEDFANSSKADFRRTVLFVFPFTRSMPGLPRHLSSVKVVDSMGAGLIDIANEYEAFNANTTRNVWDHSWIILNTPEQTLRCLNWWKNVLSHVKKPPPEYFNDRSARYIAPLHAREASDYLDWNPAVPQWKDLWVCFWEEKAQSPCFEPLNELVNLWH